MDYSSAVLLVLFLVWILSGPIGAAALSKHNRAGIGCLLGILLGPFGLVAALLMRPRTADGDIEQRGPLSLGAARSKTLSYLLVVIGLALIALPETACKFTWGVEQTMSDGTLVEVERRLSPWVFRLVGASVLAAALVLPRLTKTSGDPEV